MKVISNNLGNFTLSTIPCEINQFLFIRSPIFFKFCTLLNENGCLVNKYWSHLESLQTHLIRMVDSCQFSVFGAIIFENEIWIFLNISHQIFYSNRVVILIIISNKQADDSTNSIILWNSFLLSLFLFEFLNVLMRSKGRKHNPSLIWLRNLGNNINFINWLMFNWIKVNKDIRSFKNFFEKYMKFWTSVAP